MAGIEVRDRDDAPAVLQQCEACGAHVLIRPGGLCAGCVAQVGLARDQDPKPYDDWRRRVSEEIQHGPGGF